MRGWQIISRRQWTGTTKEAIHVSLTGILHPLPLPKTCQTSMNFKRLSSDHQFRAPIPRGREIKTPARLAFSDLLTVRQHDFKGASDTGFHLLTLRRLSYKIFASSVISFSFYKMKRRIVFLGSNERNSGALLPIS